MFFFEIRNVKTQQTAEVASKNFATACQSIGWKARECRCVWKSSVENGY